LDRADTPDRGAYHAASEAILKRGGFEVSCRGEPARRGVVDNRKIGGASDMSELARALATHRLGKPAAAPLLDRLRRCVLDQSKRALEKHAQRRPVPISSVSIA